MGNCENVKGFSTSLSDSRGLQSPTGEKCVGVCYHSLKRNDGVLQTEQG